jgi:hypothetical protein
LANDTLIGSASRSLLLHRRHVGAGTFVDFGGHADRFAQRRVGVDGLADVDGVSAHFDGEANFADQVTRVRADDAAADDAVGLVGALVSPVGDGTARKELFAL